METIFKYISVWLTLLITPILFPIVMINILKNVRDRKSEFRNGILLSIMIFAFVIVLYNIGGAFGN